MGGKTQSEHMYSEVPHIADIRKAAPSVPGPTYGPRTRPVAEGRGDPSKVPGHNHACHRVRPHPGRRLQFRWQPGQSAARRDIVVKARRTLAATSNTRRLSPEPRRRVQCVPIAWVAPQGHDWWDTHSENIRETPREKVSHLISNALIFGRSARPLGDANWSC